MFTLFKLNSVIYTCLILTISTRYLSRPSENTWQINRPICGFFIIISIGFFLFIFFIYRKLLFWQGLLFWQVYFFFLIYIIWEILSKINLIWTIVLDVFVLSLNEIVWYILAISIRYWNRPSNIPHQSRLVNLYPLPHSSWTSKHLNMHVFGLMKCTCRGKYTVKPKCIQTPSIFVPVLQFIHYSLENVWQKLRFELCQNKSILIMSHKFNRKVCNEFGWIAVSCSI